MQEAALNTHLYEKGLITHLVFQTQKVFWKCIN